MQKRFVALREDTPGTAWLERFVAGRREAEAWYRGSGRGSPATKAECTAQIRRHMPELLEPYEQACALVGEDVLAAQILSQFRPAPLRHGCTQAVWLGADGPALVRNYDYPLDIVSDHFESTRWLGREVISKGQRPWGGCLDGMNADGLVASVTFGGSQAQGPGFAIILIVRYVLETCSHVSEAVEVLVRIPVAQSQNVIVLDKTGAYATVFLSPERTPFISRSPVCANHQDLSSVSNGQSKREANSLARQNAALAALEESGATLAKVTEAFLTSPIYSCDAASPTVYSAVYRPAALTVDYLWPGHVMTQQIGSFKTGQYVHDFGTLTSDVVLPAIE
jgi:predicted choloylglycine hydrolase